MRNVRGYSLIEILITLVIVSFGLLGVAGIALNSLKNAHTSTARTQATMLANDIIARMRANRGAAERIPSPYRLAMDEQTFTGNSVSGADLMQWRRTLACRLPDGRGSVQIHPDSKKVTVTVKWMQRAMSRAPQARQAEWERITIETRL